MPIINGLALGAVVFGGVNSPPSSNTYTQIKVYGQAIIDHIKIQNIEKTVSDIQALQNYTIPIWDGNTIFLAKFENTLNAGNITNLTNPILNWVVKRRKSTETTFTTLATLPVGTKEYVDATTEPNVEYVYNIIATNDTEASEPLENTLSSYFYNSIIMDVDGTVAYVFDLNLDFDGYENVVAQQIYEGFNKYPAYSFGKRDYKTGTVTAILSSEYSSSGITQTVDYIKSFNTFINNGNLKIFKDRKGNVLKVVTTGGVKQKPVNIGITEQPYEITFNFTEVGEVNG